MSDLQKRFEAVLWEDVHAVRSRGYHAGYYMRMLSEYGAVAACKKLLSEPMQAGLLALREIDALQWSMEQRVTEPRFAGLFTPAEIREARNRRTQLSSR